MAPVNHRYSTKKIRNLLLDSDLTELAIVEDYSGLYVIAQKK